MRRIADQGDHTFCTSQLEQSSPSQRLHAPLVPRYGSMSMFVYASKCGEFGIVPQAVQYAIVWSGEKAPRPCTDPRHLRELHRLHGAPACTTPVPVSPNFADATLCVVCGVLHETTVPA